MREEEGHMKVMKVKKKYNFKDFEFLLHIANFKGWETSHIEKENT